MRQPTSQRWCRTCACHERGGGSAGERMTQGMTLAAAFGYSGQKRGRIAAIAATLRRRFNSARRWGILHELGFSDGIREKILGSEEMFVCKLSRFIGARIADIRTVLAFSTHPNIFRELRLFELPPFSFFFKLKDYRHAFRCLRNAQLLFALPPIGASMVMFYLVFLEPNLCAWHLSIGFLYLGYGLLSSSIAARLIRYNFYTQYEAKIFVFTFALMFMLGHVVEVVLFFEPQSQLHHFVKKSSFVSLGAEIGSVALAWRFFMRCTAHLHT